MPKSKTPRQPKPLYRIKPPKPVNHELVHATPIEAAHFALREDGSIAVERREEKRAPTLTYSDPARSLWLYHGNCFELLDAIAAKYPEGRFDCIFADPPYFLSNGGITCHAGKMVKVDKGDWDRSQGADENHNFNHEWLARCQRVLKPNGTIWVSGTLHVIFSIGFAMQQLGFKILNDIAWEKPNPPPNLSCRYFTHSTETVLWVPAGVPEHFHPPPPRLLPQVIGRQNPARQQRIVDRRVQAIPQSRDSAAAQRSNDFAVASFRSAPPGRSPRSFRCRA